MQSGTELLIVVVYARDTQRIQLIVVVYARDTQRIRTRKCVLMCETSLSARVGRCFA